MPKASCSSSIVRDRISDKPYARDAPKALAQKEIIVLSDSETESEFYSAKTPTPIRQGKTRSKPTSQKDNEKPENVIELTEFPGVLEPDLLAVLEADAKLAREIAAEEQRQLDLLATLSPEDSVGDYTYRLIPMKS